MLQERIWTIAYWNLNITAKISDIIVRNNMIAFKWQLVDSASDGSRKPQLVASNNSIRLSWGSPHNNSWEHLDISWDTWNCKVMQLIM